jgi:hypothetical protein
MRKDSMISTQPLHRRVTAALAAALVVAPPSVVLSAATAFAADDATSVLVLPYAPVYGELPQSLGDKTGEMLTQELNATDDVEVLKPAAAAQGEGKDPAAEAEKAQAAADKAYAQAKEQQARGDEYIEKLKFKPAADTFEKAIELYRANADWLTDFTPLADAYLKLSVAMFRLGREEEGEDLLLNVVRLDPGRELKKDQYPPLFIHIFDNLKKKAVKKGKGSLKVVSAPPGAKAFVDGRETGETPLLVRDLLIGEHYVRVEKAGLPPWAGRVDVRKDREIEVRADLGGGSGPMGEAMAAVGRNRVDVDTVKKLRQIAVASKAPYVIFGGVFPQGENTGVQSYLYRVRDDAVAPLVTLQFDSEMLGASIEIYKLAGDVQEKIKKFPAVSTLPALPLTVSATSAPKEEKITEVTTQLPAVAAEDEKTASAGAGTGGRSPARGPVAPKERGPVRTPAGTSVVVAQPDEEGAPATASAPAAEPAPRTVDVEKVESGEVDLLPERERRETRSTAPRLAVEPDQLVVPKDEQKPQVDLTWLWISLAVVAVGGGATAGTMAALGVFNTPSTSATVTASWTH